MEKIKDLNINNKETVEFLHFKVEKLEILLEKSKIENENLRMKLKEKEVAPLLNAKDLSKFLGISDYAAKQLMNSRGFPKLKAGCNMAIVELLPEWIKENKGRDVLDNKYKR